MTATAQFFLTLLVGICYYLLAMAMTVYDGLLSLLFQPVLALVLTVVGIGIVGLIGLPIRLVPRLRVWWMRHWWVSFVLGATAFAMMWASWLPDFRAQVWDQDLGQNEDTFRPYLSLGGWLLTLFAVFHFFPPVWRKG